MDTREQSAALHRELATVPVDAAGRRRGFSEDIKRRVVEHATTAARAGRSTAEIAMALGLGLTTLSRWMRRAAAPEAFREVTVVDEAPVPAASELYVVTHPKSGIVVDGLTLDALARLLRALS